MTTGLKPPLNPYIYPVDILTPVCCAQL